ncbi:MAG: hypothetical protein EZS28_029687 [Streblomastix strix]|uniref:Uncharacterized protein n=1 Tax=Streblomastix strix TaxID=222440 RepID=A0A5J4UVS1_9EUKA|nr:MAG: hypothetical protein EZS28_029687 [Streblomastix strix]
MPNAISSANKLAELSFRPGFIPTSQMIDDILFPSLSGFIELLKSLTKQLINIMKRFGNNFSSINKDTNKNEKTREQSSLIYPIDVVSNIQSLLNTSLNQFCQITHQLESENNLPQFIIPRVDLLSSITTAVETCAFYIEVYRGCQTPINSHTQIIPSNALAVFRAAVVPILLNPSHQRARNQIYKEIYQCIQHTQRMMTLVIFGDRNKYKGENYQNFRSESQSPNSRYRFDINNQSKPKKKKSNKKDKNETSSTENKTKTSTKHKKIISQQNPSSPQHPIYAIQRTPTGTRVPLGMVVDKEGYETWSEHVDRMGFHIQTHPDKLDEEIIRRQMQVKKSNWKVNGQKKELEFNEGCMSRKRNESKQRKKKRIKKIKKQLDEKRSNGEEQINEGDKSNEKRRRRIKSKEQDGKSQEESDSLTGDEESKK